MNPDRKIELLAPARNADAGIEAVLHGADAVYIGAPHFSARSAAGCGISDIARLVDFAHIYAVKVYVALNTILYEKDLIEAERIICDCWRIGVDGIIIQDMGILKLNIPPIPLHASTQCDNRNIDQILFYEQVGFSQVVLARELSIPEIALIANQTNIKLEVFVHGALCVSYSGRCYASQYFLNRSANRGDCAQICRLSYTMCDADGHNILKNRYLLSMRDLNRSSSLEPLLDAGVSSFKIEGRLKDTSYVKNITAYYRQALDNIFQHRKEYHRSSSGVSNITFSPNPFRSFNRGFTDFFSSKVDTPNMQPNNPKSTGEFVGTVCDISDRWFSISGNTTIHNGDGLCFFDNTGKLTGFRVNRSENEHIFPAVMPSLKPGLKIFRNYSFEFEKHLASKTAERKISIVLTLSETPFGLSLEAIDENAYRATVCIAIKKEKSYKPQTENIRNQLSKFGNTPFVLKELKINLSGELFIPVSIINDLRHRISAKLLSVRKILYIKELRIKINNNSFFPESELTYEKNVSNSKAAQFYLDHNVNSMDRAFELQIPKRTTLMTSKYCILRNNGRCKKQGNAIRDFKEPLFLISGKMSLRLVFDCQKCEMKVVV